MAYDGVRTVAPGVDMASPEARTVALTVADEPAACIAVSESVAVVDSSPPTEDVDAGSVACDGASDAGNMDDGPTIAEGTLLSDEVPMPVTDAICAVPRIALVKPVSVCADAGTGARTVPTDVLPDIVPPVNAALVPPPISAVIDVSDTVPPACVAVFWVTVLPTATVSAPAAAEVASPLAVISSP